MSIQNNASDSALESNHQRGSPSMNTHNDDLRVRLRRIRNRGSRYKSFFAESGAQPGTKDISAPDREARESRGLAPRILAAAAAPPYGHDQGLDRTPDTREARRLMPGFSIRRDASSSKGASCVTAGRGRQLSQRTFATSSAMA